MAVVAGLAPDLPPDQPAGPVRWWTARGRLTRTRLVVAGPGEERETPFSDGVVGLAAPCSLPIAFLEHLGLQGSRQASLDALARRTVRRLLADARAFAARRERGRKHPLRTPAESLPALDRRRLALFHAALPLLRIMPARPWAPERPPCLVEVDVPSVLAALGLPAAGLSGDREEAIARRARVLADLADGALGFRVAVAHRDFAVASYAALRAVVAAATAAWVVRATPTPPGPEAEAWLPLPARA